MGTACELHNIKDIIHKKKHGETLQESEIEFAVAAITKGSIEREQIGALLMAIWLRDMTASETTKLTHCMVHSGKVFDWPKDWVDRGLLVDKHSTGGVGDKVSLVLAPALAACGLKIPMISGRALAHTGGTLDKLESIPGFNVSLSPDEIKRLLEEVGCCIVGQTADIVPADKVLYSSRDVTCTIDSLPLIVSSIISKKAAESISSLVLDVKYGRAAFMKAKDDARNLAESMVAVGNGLGIKTVAVLTSMDNPLGHYIGNALEVYESVRCLHGEGPSDLEELVAIEGALLLCSSGRVEDIESGEQMIRSVLRNGQGLEKFRRMVIGQGASEEDARQLCQLGSEFSVLPAAKHKTDIASPASGYIHFIEPLSIAKTSYELGGGRAGHAEKINHAVGLQLRCKPGDRVEKGDIIAVVHHDSALSDSMKKNVADAFNIDELKPDEFSVFRDNDIVRPSK